MELQGEVAESSADHGGRWLLILVAFGTLPALLFSLIVVGALAMTDRDLVTTRADQRSIDLGRPFVWIHQDQKTYDPPLPTQLGMSSPWANPTNVSGAGLLLDLLAVFASTALMLTLLWVVALRFVRILRTARHA